MTSFVPTVTLEQVNLGDRIMSDKNGSTGCDWGSLGCSSTLSISETPGIKFETAGSRGSRVGVTLVVDTVMAGDAGGGGDSVGTIWSPRFLFFRFTGNG